MSVYKQEYTYNVWYDVNNLAWQPLKRTVALIDTHRSVDSFRALTPLSVLEIVFQLFVNMRYCDII